MNLTASDEGGRLVITVGEDRIDAAIAIRFKDAMRKLLQERVPEDQPRTVVLDLDRVSFLDSSGLGAIVAIRKFLGPERPLELRGLRGLVAKVFRLTRMDSVFTIHDWESAGSEAPPLSGNDG